MASDDKEKDVRAEDVAYELENGSKASFARRLLRWGVEERGALNLLWKFCNAAEMVNFRYTACASRVENRYGVQQDLLHLFICEHEHTVVRTQSVRAQRSHSNSDRQFLHWTAWPPCIWLESARLLPGDILLQCSLCMRARVLVSMPTLTSALTAYASLVRPGVHELACGRCVYLDTRSGTYHSA